MDAKRRFKSSVTTGLTYSVGTVGFATSTSVCEVYRLGSRVAVENPTASEHDDTNGENPPVALDHPSYIVDAEFTVLDHIVLQGKALS